MSFWYFIVTFNNKRILLALNKRLSKEDKAPLLKKRQINKRITIIEIRMILKTASWSSVLDGGGWANVPGWWLHVGIEGGWANGTGGLVRACSGSRGIRGLGGGDTGGWWWLGAEDCVSSPGMELRWRSIGREE